jgi:Ion channel
VVRRAGRTFVEEREKRESSMLRQMLVGSFVSALVIVIHALVTFVAIRVARTAGFKPSSRPGLSLAGIMVAISLVLMVAHIAEVFVWSVAYAMANAVQDDASLIYFAFVNYTTLGYGDITPLAEWRLLGPMAAMNGILMFGWSTALMFEVLRKTIVHQDSLVGAAPTGL